MFYPLINKNKRPDHKNILSNSILEKAYSNKINGRWENQYIDLDLIPKIKPVFLKACGLGKSKIHKSLVISHKQLRSSYNQFWFNISNSGDCTGWYDHKENAKISGLYYLTVPKRFGNIIFRKKDKNKDERLFVK